jgi:hypothetical protein
MNSDKKNLLNLFSNSTIACLLSYLLIFIPSQLITHFVAKAFNIPTSFHSFKLVFPIEDYTYLWNQQSVVTIYIAAPIFVLIVGILLIRYFFLFSYFTKLNVNLFLIWSYAHCMNIFFGGLAVGIPLHDGFGYVPRWLYLPDPVLFSLIVFSIIMLLVNGFILRWAFVTVSFSETMINKPYPLLKYKTAIAFLPFLVVSLLFLVAGFPINSMYERLLLLSMFVQLMGIFPFNYMHNEVKEENRKVVFAKKSLIMLVGVFAIFIIWKLLHTM